MARKLHTKKQSNQANTPSLDTSSSQSKHALDKATKEDDENPQKSSNTGKKLQCDLCKLSYTTKEELTEHLLSLMHHTKMEDKEENPLHKCTLCGVSYTFMADYRRHITTGMHQKQLCRLREATDDGNQQSGAGERKQQVKNYHQSSSNTDVAHFGSFSPTFQNEDSFQSNLKSYNHVVGNNQKGSNFRFGYNRDIAHSKPQKNHHFEKKLFLYKKKEKERVKGKQRVMQNGVKTFSGRRDYPQVHFYEPWGSGLFGDYYKNHYRAGNPTQSFEQNAQNPWRTNHSHQNGLNEHFPKFTNFTSDDISDDWDEQSLIQHEEFLAGMSDMYIPNKYQASGSADIERAEDFSVQGRKQPWDVGAGYRPFTKLSRFVDDLSLARSAPLQQPAFGTSEEHRSILTSKPVAGLNMRPQMPFNRNARSSVLERAENICRELQAKRQGLQLRDYSVLNQPWDPGYSSWDQDIKLQTRNTFSKNNKRWLKRVRGKEKYHFGPCLPLSQHSRRSISPPVSALKTSDADIVTSAPVVVTKTLDEIRESIENVLESSSKSVNKEKSPNKVRTLAPPETKQRRCSAEDAGAVRSSESRDVAVDKSSTLKPPSKLQLTKNIIKKMVNAPYSRDERLQLAKLLHSRDKSKTVPCSIQRTSFQLEGLCSAAVTSTEVNLDADQNCAVQTIKLEDLAVAVRHQILNIIGEDITNLNASRSEEQAGEVNLQDKLPEKGLDSPSAVITLSDDEPQTDANKQMKIQSQKISKIITPGEVSKTTEIKKKKKRTVSRPVSECDSGVSVIPSGGCTTISEPQHVDNCGSSSETGSAKRKTKKKKKYRNIVGHDDIAVCSSNVEKGMKEARSSEPSGGSTNSELLNSSITNQLPTDSEQRLFPKNENESLSDRQNQSQISSSVILEKFPSDTNNHVVGRISSAKNLRASVSLISGGSIQLSEHHPHVSDSVSEVMEISSSEQARQEQSFSSEHRTGSSLSPDLMRSVPSQPRMTPSPPYTAPQVSSLHTESRLSSLYTKERSSVPQNLEKNSTEMTRSSPTPEISVPLPHTPRRLTLPPSTWLMERTSQPTICENHDRETSDESSVPRPTLIETKVEDSYEVMDLSDSEAHSTTDNEPSSQIMRELLEISEREENLKHEKVNLDLRLSRLHKLLEQAVVQINKCTERRNQLHKEEQELSRQRLSLLREAASLNPKTDMMSVNKQLSGFEHTSRTHFQNMETDCSNDATSTGSLSYSTQGPSQSSTIAAASKPFVQTSSLTSTIEDKPQGTSLSKADWLAKFSSFLPCQPNREGDQMTSDSPVNEHIHQSSSSVTSSNQIT